MSAGRSDRTPVSGGPTYPDADATEVMRPVSGARGPQARGNDHDLTQVVRGDEPTDNFEGPDADEEDGQRTQIIRSDASPDDEQTQRWR